MLAIIKVAILVIFFILLFRVFYNQQYVGHLFSAFKEQMNTLRVGYLIMALILVFLNWWSEAIKWRALMQPVSLMNNYKAIRAVLIGLTTSIFTPNRIGEYLGRVLTVSRTKKLAAMTVLGFGSLIQLATLSILGILSLLYLIGHSYPLPYGDVLSWLLISVLLLIVIVLPTQAKTIFMMLRKKFGHYLPDLWKQLDFVRSLPQGYYRPVYLITIFRIGIYVFQYWLLLQFFQINVRADFAIATILLGYFIQSGLPLPSLFALLARGEITLLLWKFFAVNELSILAASYGLWVINVVLPALVGMIYVMKIKTNVALENELS